MKTLDFKQKLMTYHGLGFSCLKKRQRYKKKSQRWEKRRRREIKWSKMLRESEEREEEKLVWSWMGAGVNGAHFFIYKF